ncbi:phenylacetic acid degradation operon negative regulatory protein [Janthinobacterium sp. CG_23.3]|uniref:phenylacetic acid degradation operon negative regulatory protein PaaX n=1 Tax=unclassified Janthinobacterium TaxID=2610881 RepID=UPI00034BDEE9|nr:MULTISPECIES: phenylacetic acid degradation operon negative regulatory protein PaaX [unclassified Janthinobacterium]MEC5161810.1 phenylacetic acid degradation operon negative regulatory protein [Janthinobacterium sp. CG_S6]
MSDSTSTEWISDFLAADPPRSKSLVMTIFGDAIVPHGGVVWLGSLIELLAPFGVNDRLLRTSVFRLAQEGWLGAQRDGRRSAYAIMPAARRRFARAYRRIYAPLAAHWDGSWTIIIGSGGNIAAAERGALRKELLWEGYSVIAPGIFGHPGADAEVLEEILSRNGVQGKLYVCRATELPGVPLRPLRDMVAEGWDLSAVTRGYEQFSAQFQPLLALLRAAPVAPEQAFVIRLLLIHAYRRVQLHDPQLPLELLPAQWPGSAAYELARALYRLVYTGAEGHLMATLRREDERAAPAEEAFYQRFGGLR